MLIQHPLLVRWHSIPIASLFNEFSCEAFGVARTHHSLENLAVLLLLHAHIVVFYDDAYCKVLSLRQHLLGLLHAILVEHTQSSRLVCSIEIHSLLLEIGLPGKVA